MLTELKVKNAKAGDKAQRIYDTGGMYLEVMPNGSKYWRLKYRFDGKEKRLALGVYGNVSLSEARTARDEARVKLAKGIDPGAEKQGLKVERRVAAANTFAAIADNWKKQKSKEWSPSNLEKITWLLDKNILPWLGERPIAAIKTPEVLKLLKRIEDRGAIETAHRAKLVCGQVFKYAIVTGVAERNPAADLAGALPRVKAKHHAAITSPKELAKLMKAIDGYTGSFVVGCALKLSAMLFVRPGELRHMEWEEIDFSSKEWNIPAEKMKMKTPHLVPLSRQAIEILKELMPLTGDGKYVLPSERRDGRPMSENTVNAALRALGYSKEQMTAHGFRATARTILDEVLNFRPDYIEHQLAHEIKDPNGRAYNRTKHLAERKKMMQDWSDYLM